MLTFKPIELEDKELFERYTLCHGYHNLEASFANVFIWRRLWNIQMATDDTAMYLYLSNGKESFMLPPFLNDCDISIAGALDRCEEYLYSCGFWPVLRGVTMPFKHKIESDCPGRYSFTEDRNNFEYVYSAENLCTLRGKKYHSKRNHINKLLSSHSAHYRRYTKDDYDDCIRLYMRWAENKGGLMQSYQSELDALKDALKYKDELGLVGGLLIVDGNLEAFTVGEKFGDDMAIVHIEKANPSMQGAYAMINREFVCHEWRDLQYINREEDMGIEGLRKAKLSYNPVFLSEKYVGIRSG